jgi:hypothetical protein
MSKRTAFFVVGLVAVVAIGWYLVSPLFVDDVVDEAFPFEAPDTADIEEMSEAERSELEAELEAALPDQAQVAALSPEEQEAVEEKVIAAAATIMMDKTMDDEMMAAADEWAVVAEGQFAGTDSLHQGSGSATIYQQGDERVLRFENFSVTNGPDLHVYLIEDPAPGLLADVGENALDLGKLKGNLGDQNYQIPAGVDLSVYKAAIIYCVPFRVVFATASLG